MSPPGRPKGELHRSAQRVGESHACLRTLPPAGPVPSPCTSVCTMEPVTGFCAGCFRTLDEIAAWSLMDDDAKRQVWSALARRRPAAAKVVDADDPFRTGTDAQR